MISQFAFIEFSFVHRSGIWYTVVLLTFGVVTFDYIILAKDVPPDLLSLVSADTSVSSPLV